MRTVYRYNPDNNMFIGVEETEPDPIEGLYSEPLYTTFVSPPHDQTSEWHRFFWVEDEQRWEEKCIMSGELFCKVAESLIKDIVNVRCQNAGYDSILTLSTYATSKVDRWREEAQEILNYRDDCLLKLYEHIEKTVVWENENPTRFVEEIC